MSVTKEEFFKYIGDEDSLSGYRATTDLARKSRTQEC